MVAIQTYQLGYRLTNFFPTFVQLSLWTEIGDIQSACNLFCISVTGERLHWEMELNLSAQPNSNTSTLLQIVQHPILFFFNHESDSSTSLSELQAWPWQ